MPTWLNFLKPIFKWLGIITGAALLARAIRKDAEDDLKADLKVEELEDSLKRTHEAAVTHEIISNLNIDERARRLRRLDKAKQALQADE